MLGDQTVTAWSIVVAKELRADRTSNGQPFSLAELDAYEAGCKLGFKSAVELLRQLGRLKE